MNRESVCVQEFVGDSEGHVCGIRTVLVDWTKDDTGRWVMKEVPGTTHDNKPTALACFSLKYLKSEILMKLFPSFQYSLFTQNIFSEIYQLKQILLCPISS